MDDKSSFFDFHLTPPQGGEGGVGGVGGGGGEGLVRNPVGDLVGGAQTTTEDTPQNTLPI